MIRGSWKCKFLALGKKHQPFLMIKWGFSSYFKYLLIEKRVDDEDKWKLVFTTDKHLRNWAREDENHN